MGLIWSKWIEAQTTFLLLFYLLLFFGPNFQAALWLQIISLWLIIRLVAPYSPKFVSVLIFTGYRFYMSYSYNKPELFILELFCEWKCHEMGSPISTMYDDWGVCEDAQLANEQ